MSLKKQEKRRWKPLKDPNRISHDIYSRSRSRAISILISKHRKEFDKIFQKLKAPEGTI